MAILRSTLTCPDCGHARTETMPTDACMFFYVCTGCGTRLRPKRGDCCVFCSYADVPCPPIQAIRAGEGNGADCGDQLGCGPVTTTGE
ncbi:GDCCVxC domain-containing (seleno)protein [Falsiroseomonas sp. HC035]|uniref:GDCCVxC domain-containing (seleno)protein n=1 Tax=Falsiroseomonas sp. HC035 TaxID=3390999 RepID=UPI003D3136EE